MRHKGVLTVVTESRGRGKIRVVVGVLQRATRPGFPVSYLGVGGGSCLHSIGEE